MTVDADSARKIIAGVRLALGAGWVAPAPLMRLFGIDPAANPVAPFVGRLFCARDLYMAGQIMTFEGEALNRVLAWGVAVDVVDALAALAAGAKGQLPKRTVVLAASTALAAAGLGMVARRR